VDVGIKRIQASARQLEVAFRQAGAALSELSLEVDRLRKVLQFVEMQRRRPRKGS
jgi:HPt (histidine-containing phosphotransfer) domain-containing protein